MSILCHERSVKKPHTCSMSLNSCDPALALPLLSLGHKSRCYYSISLHLALHKSSVSPFPFLRNIGL